MEGNRGTIIDVGTKAAPVTTRGGGVDGELSVTITGDKVTNTSLPSDSTSGNQHPEEGRVEDLHALTTKTLDNGLQTADQAQSTEQTDKQKERTKSDQELADEQITEGFEKFWNTLDDKGKEQFLKYAGKLLAAEESKSRDQSFDMLVELIRFIMLLFALLSLQRQHPEKEIFSGKELLLSDMPPDGEEENPLTKIINGKSSKESWKNLKKEVEAIENVPFSTLMSRVLAANETHSIKKFKIKIAEKQEDSLLKKLIKNKLAERGSHQVTRTISVAPRG